MYKLCVPECACVFGCECMHACVCGIEGLAEHRCLAKQDWKSMTKDTALRMQLRIIHPPKKPIL